jgi:hypothetical protein
VSGIASEPGDIVLRDRVLQTTGRRLDRDHLRRNRPTGRRRAGRRGHNIGVYVPIFAVSTVAQTLDQQNDALVKAGVSKTFSDTMSGARDDRPGLAELMAYVRAGDVVVVWKLDRLGRNTLHIGPIRPAKEVPHSKNLDGRSIGIRSNMGRGPRRGGDNQT